MTRRLPIFGFGLAFAVQAALLGSMLASRALTLANGEEVRLPVVPVDPRDFLRGDFVILSYPMSRLNAADLDGADEFSYAAPVFVELRNDGDVWKPTAMHHAKPDGATSVRGTITNHSRPNGCQDASCAVYEVAYNLEKFFVPEGEGRDIEMLRNTERVQADVAIGSDGRAILKRLRIDGAVRYEESFF